MRSLNSEDIPQKESLDLILQLPDMLKKDIGTADDISRQIGHVIRHGHFVLQAGRILGIVRRSGSKHVITHKGRILLMMDKGDAKHYLRFLVERSRVMRHLFAAGKATYSRVLDKRIITKILKEDVGLADSTARRRASTLVAWLKWLSTFKSVKRLGQNRFSLD